jgi:hypothetical protein
MAADSHSWVGELDRFDRLFEAGFGTSEIVFDAIDRVEQMLPPPPVVEAVLQQLAWQYCDGLKQEAVDLFAPLYYACMRSGFSAAEAVLAARGITVGDVEQATFDERFRAITTAWTGLDPWAALSDLAYYMLDDLAPAIHEQVAEVMRQAVPEAELPDEWEMIPPLRQPLDRAINGMMVAAAAALAAANETRL